jgi:hypothetical protein
VILKARRALSERRGPAWGPSHIAAVGMGPESPHELASGRRGRRNDGGPARRPVSYPLRFAPPPTSTLKPPKDIFVMSNGIFFGSKLASLGSFITAAFTLSR